MSGGEGGVFGTMTTTTMMTMMMMMMTMGRRDAGGDGTHCYSHHHLYILSPVYQLVMYIYRGEMWPGQGVVEITNTLYLHQLPFPNNPGE